MPSSHPRQSLRKQLRQQRRTLTMHQQQIASDAVLEQLQQCDFMLRAQAVAIYLPFDGELDTSTIIAWFWSKHIPVYLPVCHSSEHTQLFFQRYDPHTPLKQNTYGIQEPQLDPTQQLAVCDLDVIFLPLVGFDRQCNRLGMGKGIYDRTLSILARDQLQVRLVGLAHDCQLLEQLPVAPWDHPLHHVVTPSQMFTQLALPPSGTE